LALTYLAFLEYGQGNNEKAETLLAQAHKVFDERKSTSTLSKLTPKRLEDLAPPKFPPETKQVATNVYAVKVPFETEKRKTFTAWIDNQAMIVKTNDGSVVIVNPVNFDVDSIKWINSLGPVKAIINTTTGHGISARYCTTIWPNAALYGTDKKDQHRQKDLKWNYVDEGLLQ